MSDNIKLNIKEHLGDEMYMDHPLTLVCKTSISINGTEPFCWVGKYKNVEIIVTLQRGDSEDFVNIQNETNLNIDHEIIKEVGKIIRKLN